MTGLSVVTLFGLYAEHFTRNARLDELKAGIKTGRRNIKNLRYADDTTLKTESRGTKKLLDEGGEELKKNGLKLGVKEKLFLGL